MKWQDTLASIGLTTLLLGVVLLVKSHQDIELLRQIDAKLDRMATAKVNTHEINNSNHVELHERPTVEDIQNEQRRLVEEARRKQEERQNANLSRNL